MWLLMLMLMSKLGDRMAWAWGLSYVAKILFLPVEEEREELGGKVVEHKIEGLSSHCSFISVQFMSKSIELNREFIKTTD